MNDSHASACAVCGYADAPTNVCGLWLCTGCSSLDCELSPAVLEGRAHSILNSWRTADPKDATMLLSEVERCQAIAAWQHKHAGDPVPTEPGS